MFRMTDDSSDSNWLEDLCNMLHKSTRLEVRLTASSNIMALTGSDEGRLFIRQNKPLVSAMLCYPQVYSPQRETVWANFGTIKFYGNSNSDISKIFQDGSSVRHSK